VDTPAKKELEELLPWPPHANLDLTNHHNGFGCDPYRVSEGFIYGMVPRGK